MTTPVGLVFYSPGWLRKAGGLTLLERAVLAFRRAGFSEVGVVVETGYATELTEWSNGSRLKEQPPAWIEASADTEPVLWSAAAGFAPGRPAVVITRPMAVDPAFLSALLPSLVAHAPSRISTAFSAVFAYADGIPAQGSAVDVSPIPLPAGTAVPVDSAGDARRARRALLAQSVKPLHIDGLICFLLVRRLSVRISALLVGTPITPNQITAFSLLLGLAAAVFAGWGFWPWPAVGGALLMLSLVFDNCDGEIARVKYQGSNWGAWFDIYSDFVVNVAFMSGMAMGAYRVFDAPVYLYAGAFAVGAFTFYNGTVFRYIHRLGIPDEFLYTWWFDRRPADGAATTEAASDGPGSPLARVLSVVKYAGRRDFFIFTYLVTALLSVLHWAFWATVVGSAVNLGMITYQVFFWSGKSDGG